MTSAATKRLGAAIVILLAPALHDAGSRRLLARFHDWCREDAAPATSDDVDARVSA